MIFTAAPLSGAYLIDMEPLADERGFFARAFCVEEFAARGLAPPLHQFSVSCNAKRGTLRGLHFQAAPHGEDKVIRCTRGAMFDVIVDIRPESPTARQWFGTELTAQNHRSVYVPRGFAHGFISLADDTEVFYMISVPFAPGSGRGLRWNDPALAIRWPISPTVISARDAEFPLLDE